MIGRGALCGLAMLLAIVGCDSGPAAGVASGQGPAAWSIDPEPVLVIGEVEGRPEYQLFAVASAFRLSDGTTVVANRGTSELRYYDSEGRWLGSRGRKGQGPGEFGWLHSAKAIRGDTVFTFDASPRRVTLFPPGEEEPITVPLSLSGQMVSLADRTAAAGIHLATMTMSGDLWVVPGVPFHLLRGLQGTDDGGAAVRPELIATSGVYPFRPPLFRIDRSGQVVERSEPVSGTPSAVHDGQTQPWPLGGWQVVDAGSKTVVSGLGSERSASVRGRDAHIEVELGLPPGRAVTEQIWEDFGVAVSRRGIWWQDFLAAIPRPDTMAHYSDLVVDDHDRIWTGEFVPLALGPERRWWVFDLDGTHLATLHLPSDLEVMDIRDGYLTGVVKDDFDVERVVVYRVNDGST